jgi:hypothetical protein
VRGGRGGGVSGGGGEGGEEPASQEGEGENVEQLV